MARITLTPAERMLVSIAETERLQAAQQIDSIYQARIQSLLDSHGLTFKDKPQIVNEGQEQILVTPEAPVPLPESNV